MVMWSDCFIIDGLLFRGLFQCSRGFLGFEMRLPNGIGHGLRVTISGRLSLIASGLVESGRSVDSDALHTRASLSVNGFSDGLSRPRNATAAFLGRLFLMVAVIFSQASGPAKVPPSEVSSCTLYGRPTDPSPKSGAAICRSRSAATTLTRQRMADGCEDAGRPRSVRFVVAVELLGRARRSGLC